MLEYEFMRNALYAIIIVTPLFGLVGTLIVNNKMAFFSDALGHSALTGIAIGARKMINAIRNVIVIVDGYDDGEVLAVDKLDAYETAEDAA